MALLVVALPWAEPDMVVVCFGGFLGGVLVDGGVAWEVVWRELLGGRDGGYVDCVVLYLLRCGSDGGQCGGLVRWLGVGEGHVRLSFGAIYCMCNICMCR
jgi:hypothetical protein